MDAHLRQIRELGTDARHRRRAGLQRRHQRSQVPCVRRRRPARCYGSSRGTPAFIGRPSSFAVDGKQYIAVQSGWGVDARGDAGAAHAADAGRCPRFRKAERSGCSRCRSRLRTLASPHHHGRLRARDCRRHGGDRGGHVSAPMSASATAASWRLGSACAAIARVDAGGLLVMPGGVDSHCHIEQLQPGGGADEETFVTGSRSALAGGTTTVIPVLDPVQGPRAEPVRWRNIAAAPRRRWWTTASTRSSPMPTDDVIHREVPEIVASGIRSLKVFLTYDPSAPRRSPVPPRPRGGQALRRAGHGALREPRRHRLANRGAAGRRPHCPEVPRLVADPR